jgi:uncharacterized protein YdeI (BOF family)
MTANYGSNAVTRFTSTIYTAEVSGKLVLLNNSAPPTSTTAANVVDFLGYGSVNMWSGYPGSGLSAAPAGSAYTSLRRTANDPTGNNNTDFIAGAINLKYLAPFQITSVPAAGGTIESVSTVQLYSNPGTIIRFTTDGNDPTIAYGTLYSTPIPISFTGKDQHITIKAIAIVNGFAGDVQEFTLHNREMTVGKAITMPVGTVVTVEGILVYNILTADGTLDDGVFLQDANGTGISVRPGTGSYEATDITDMIEQKVRVTGEISNYYGLIRLQNRYGTQLFSIEEIIDPSLTMPTPISVTIPQINAQPQQHPFRLVSLESLHNHR